MTKKFLTYIARCSDGSLYTGITDDLKDRENRHNLGQGSNYTKQRLPIKIIYFEKFKTRKEAYVREKQLKGWKKEKKERLIQGLHPNTKTKT